MLSLLPDNVIVYAGQGQLADDILRRTVFDCLQLVNC